MPKHIHRFYKVETQTKSKYVWKCADCSWFVHAGLEHVVLGKSAICWKCGDVFIVQNLDEDKLVCVSCLVGKLVEYTEQKIEDAQTPDNETEEEKQSREHRLKIMKEMGLLK